MNREQLSWHVNNLLQANKIIWSCLRKNFYMFKIGTNIKLLANHKNPTDHSYFGDQLKILKINFPYLEVETDDNRRGLISKTAKIDIRNYSIQKW